ncbi:MAG: CHAD domain-containing protein [Deltaproteobacteria bacterium]|nr:CHAD domain-containing protein [Deltaproteobacteria bacterium]
MSLQDWMLEATALHARALTADLAAPDDEVVHDLRVSLRRCRSLAQGLAAVDLLNAGVWKDLARQAKGLFDGLGQLRDAQVMGEWATKLVPTHEALRARLDAPLPALVAAAREAVAVFDVVAWEQRTVSMPPLATLALQQKPLLLHLARARYDEARALHVFAMRFRTPDSLHETRIGVKRLRYTLESLLPKLHDVVAKPLKRMQEQLGDLHDLDVLAGVVADVDAAALSPIHAARAECLAAYKAMAVGRAGSWSAILKALPHDDDVVFRCRRSFVLAVGAGIGIDGRTARRAERAALALGRQLGSLSLAERFAALLAPANTKVARRAARSLLGFGDDVKAQIRLALRSPLIEAVRTFVR